MCIINLSITLCCFGMSYLCHMMFAANQLGISLKKKISKLMQTIEQNAGHGGGSPCYFLKGRCHLCSKGIICVQETICNIHRILSII